MFRNNESRATGGAIYVIGGCVGVLAYLALSRADLLAGFMSLFLLGSVLILLQTPKAYVPTPPMQNRSNKYKDAPLTREQAVNVQREIERQRRKHENHEMMRRGAFRPNMRNSKRGRKG